ncbi:MAG: rhomboid family intramembrane serine protease [Nanoarchaeota archaeon]|nr:rhomboid family intramembrane serine protease [Nanoarchaeota archaeon]
MRFHFYAIKLSGIMILIFVLQLLIPGFTDFFVLNGDAWSQPWRFLSAVFLHGGAGHLLYNLFALALFGSILEKLIGGKKFVVVFFITGILANLVSINFYDSSLGASGAIFGVIGALIFVRPLQVVWAFGLPMPIFIAGVLWAFGDVIGIFIPDNVGNIAHLSGMFFGLVLGALYKKRKRRRANPKFVIDEGSVRSWERGWIG